MTKDTKSKTFHQEQQKLIKYLNKRHLTLSTGRKIVFNEVFHFHGHFSAEELVKRCKDKKLKASRATIYRTLNELVESGVIRKTAFGEKHFNFEHTYDEKPHHHAYCIRTGKFFELPDLNEEELYLPLLKKMGFDVLGHELHFYGISKESQDDDKS